MLRLFVYLLAGGRSSRFGADKARALLAGRPLLMHVADALAPRAAEVCVVAERADKYADLGLRTIGDAGGGLGPLDGLRAALCDLPPGEDWLLLAGCDVIGLRPQWVDALWAAAVKPRARAVAFRDARWQPLLALYRRQLLPQVELQLAAGERALWRLLQAVDATALPLPAGWADAMDIDTPERLAAARSSDDVGDTKGDAPA